MQNYNLTVPFVWEFFYMGFMESIIYSEKQFEVTKGDAMIFVKKL